MKKSTQDHANAEPTSIGRELTADELGKVNGGYDDWGGGWGDYGGGDYGGGWDSGGMAGYDVMMQIEYQGWA